MTWCAVILTPRQGDVLLSHQPYSPGSAPQQGPALPASNRFARSNQREDPLPSISGRAQAFRGLATSNDITQKQAYDNPVSLEVSASGEWPLGASIERKRLRRISSVLKDQPAPPQSPSVKQGLPGYGEESQQEAQPPRFPHQSLAERRPVDIQPRSPSRYSATAGAGPPGYSTTAGAGQSKHSATAGAGSVAADRLTPKRGTPSEAEVQRKTRQQAVDQLKAMLQLDSRLPRRESADEGHFLLHYFDFVIIFIDLTFHFMSSYPANGLQSALGHSRTSANLSLALDLHTSASHPL